MANNVQQPDWDDLGRSIQEAVDKAIGSRNFEKLNQTISDLAGRAADAGAEAVCLREQSALFHCGQGHIPGAGNG